MSHCEVCLVARIQPRAIVGTQDLDRDIGEVGEQAIDAVLEVITAQLVLELLQLQVEPSAVNVNVNCMSSRPRSAVE